MWIRNNEVVKIYTRSRDTQTRSNNCFRTRSHYMWARNNVFAPVVIKYTKFTPVVSILEPVILLYFNHLHFLVSIILILPFVTADCERLFSKLGYIKTADRNRLGDILNDLLLVYDASDK